MSETEVADNNVPSKQDKPKRRVTEGLISKLKKIKHLDIILTILFIAIILLIYFSTIFNSKPASDKIQNNKIENSSTNIVTLEDYTNNLEKKLEVTLRAIKNAGEVSVMLNFDRGIEKVIAYTTETKTSPDGTTTEVKSPVLISNNGKTETVTLQEVMPVPTSIIIVATGAGNTNVKLELLRAVQACFNISSSSIEIFTGN